MPSSGNSSAAEQLHAVIECIGQAQLVGAGLVHETAAPGPERSGNSRRSWPMSKDPRDHDGRPSIARG